MITLGDHVCPDNKKCQTTVRRANTVVS